MRQTLEQSVRRVIELLVAGKYSELEALTNGLRLSAEEMAQAIRGYGRELTSPPNEEFDLMTVVEIRNAQPRRWSITMQLWTCEEGRSDLSVELTLVAADDGFTIELDDIHVL
jgi:hypothetical protein